MNLLERVLERVPEMYRLPLVLREVEGLSTAQVAEMLELNEDTVKTRVSRARQFLREGIEFETGDRLREVFSFEAPRCDRVVALVFRALEKKTHTEA